MTTLSPLPTPYAPSAMFLASETVAINAAVEKMNGMALDVCGKAPRNFWLDELHRSSAATVIPSEYISNPRVLARIFTIGQPDASEAKLRMAYARPFAQLLHSYELATEMPEFSAAIFALERLCCASWDGDPSGFKGMLPWVNRGVNINHKAIAMTINAGDLALYGGINVTRKDWEVLRLRMGPTSSMTTEGTSKFYGMKTLLPAPTKESAVFLKYNVPDRRHETIGHTNFQPNPIMAGAEYALSIFSTGKTVTIHLEPVLPKGLAAEVAAAESAHSLSLARYYQLILLERGNYFLQGMKNWLGDNEVNEEIARQNVQRKEHPLPDEEKQDQWYSKSYWGQV